jgi:hypothetical protein
MTGRNAALGRSAGRDPAVNPRRKIAAFDAQPNKRTGRLVEGVLGATGMFTRSLAAAERP